MAAEQHKKSWWKSVWTIMAAALLVIGGIVDVAGFIDLVKPLGKVIKNVAEWLYPFWLTIGLGALLIVATGLLLLLRRRLRAAHAGRVAAEQQARAAEEQAAALTRRGQPERIAHDRRILKGLRSTLPRSDIAYWGEVDFGGTWYGTKTRQLMELHYDRDAVEDRFLDPELERLRSELMTAARALMKGTSKWGGPSKAGPGLYDLGDLDGIGVFDKQHQERFEEQWEERREELGKRADKLVEAYDALMARAQEHLPAAFEDASTAAAPRAS